MNSGDVFILDCEEGTPKAAYAPHVRVATGRVVGRVGVWMPASASGA